MAHPIVVVWSTPRSRSTAFERMMIERGDHRVFDEPFSARYYFSPERRSDRFDEDLPDSDTGSILAKLDAAAAEGPVFVKDMAYHVVDLLDEVFLGRFVNTFLVREPTAVVVSLARIWPDVTEEEAGFAALARAHAIAGQLAGAPPAVLDADELAADPAGLVAAWCDAVGIGFRPDALSWERGMVDQWHLWREWYAGVAASTGFGPPAEHPVAPPEDPRLAAIVRHARPHYERLRRSRLRGTPTRGA